MDFVNKNFQLISLLATWLVFLCGASVMVAAAIKAVRALIKKKELEPTPEPEPQPVMTPVEAPKRRRRRRLKQDQIRCPGCGEPVDPAETRMDGMKTVLIFKCPCGRVSESLED